MSQIPQIMRFNLSVLQLTAECAAAYESTDKSTKTHAKWENTFTNLIIHTEQLGKKHASMWENTTKFRQTCFQGTLKSDVHAWKRLLLLWWIIKLMKSSVQLCCEKMSCFFFQTTFFRYRLLTLQAFQGHVLKTSLRLCKTDHSTHSNLFPFIPQFVIPTPQPATATPDSFPLVSPKTQRSISVANLDVLN